MLCWTENGDHHIILGAWHNEGSLADMEEVVDGNCESRQARQQRMLMKHYLNSSVGSVPWQMDCIMADK